MKSSWQRLHGQRACHSQQSFKFESHWCANTVLLNKSKQRNKYRDEQKYTNRLCLTKTAAMCGKIGRWIEVKEINTLSLQIDFIVSTFAIKSIKFRLFRNYPKADPWAQKMNKHSLKCSKTESHVIQITSFTFFWLGHPKMSFYYLISHE